jgi:diacylglycerol kinase family enzyme
MACKCKNPDGTLSDVCIGACVKDSIVKQEEEARRDPMNGFAELILSQVEQRIQNRMTTLQVTFQKEQFELYKKAFLDGLNEGIEIGKRLNQNDY